MFQTRFDFTHKIKRRSDKLRRFCIIRFDLLSVYRNRVPEPEIVILDILGVSVCPY